MKMKTKMIAVAAFMALAVSMQAQNTATSSTIGGASNIGSSGGYGTTAGFAEPSPYSWQSFMVDYIDRLMHRARMAVKQPREQEVPMRGAKGVHK